MNTDQHRQERSFDIGSHVFVKISPWKGKIRFGKKGKLSPRYIGPFEVLRRVGAVAYEVALPLELAHIHNVFHVSVLRSYRPDHKHVIDYVPLRVEKDLTYEETPVQIIDSKEQVLRNKVISLVKVVWRYHDREEATWELKDKMMEHYPHLF
jgi:hypothetical protein